MGIHTEEALVRYGQDVCAIFNVNAPLVILAEAIHLAVRSNGAQAGEGFREVRIQ